MKHQVQIRPDGFLAAYLQKQMDGLTGHIGEAGYPFDCVEWGSEDHSPATFNEPWWRYEQTAYWVDGYIRCAILLEDEAAIENGSCIIYNVIRHPKGTYLGPEVIADPKGSYFRWPHAVFFRACMALYDYNGDRSIPEAIRAHYLGDTADYAAGRNVQNVEILCWLYEVLGDRALLDMAVDAYDRYNEEREDDACDRVALSDKKPYVHGVTYNEYFKLGAILWRHTGKEIYLAASVRAFRKAEKYFMLPGGCICSNEQMINDAYYQSIETCNVTDFTWSMEYMMKITKDPHYADLVERCVFNAGMGAVLEDFRGLQYFSSANQVIADHQSNHNLFKKGSGWMKYAPNPGTECCPGNVNRFMPNYVLNLFGNEPEGVYAYLFGAGSYVCEREGKRIEITETTDYPVVDTVTLSIKTEPPFDLYFRLPSFMSEMDVLVDGRKLRTERTPGKRAFRSLSVEKDCTVTLIMRAEVKSHGKEGRVYFTRGALTYCLAVDADRRTVTKEGKSYPDYHMYPAGAWQYAVSAKTPHYTPCGGFTDFQVGLPLPTLTVTARRIENFDLQTLRRFYYRNEPKLGRKHYVNTPHILTPRLLRRDQLILSDRTETLQLVPYGAGKLRMTVFNVMEEES